MDKTVTEEKAQEIREQVMAAVFDGKELPVGEVIEKTEEEPEPPDPWESIPEPIRNEVESLKRQAKEFESLSYRLKQAEQRIGSMTHKISEVEKARLEAEKKLSERPKPDDSASKERDEAWERFREEEPDVAAAMEARLKKEGRAPTIDELFDAISPRLEEALLKKAAPAEFTKSLDELAEDLVFIRHPQWETKVKTPEFRQFLEAHPEHLPACDSRRASDTIRVLDAFEEYAKPKKTAAQLKAEQSARIKGSAVIQPSGAGKREPSVDDMSPEEIREMVRRKVFAET